MTATPGPGWSAADYVDDIARRLTIRQPDLPTALQPPTIGEVIAAEIRNCPICHPTEEPTDD